MRSGAQSVRQRDRYSATPGPIPRAQRLQQYDEPRQNDANVQGELKCDSSTHLLEYRHKCQRPTRIELWSGESRQGDYTSKVPSRTCGAFNRRKLRQTGAEARIFGEWLRRAALVGVRNCAFKISGKRYGVHSAGLERSSHVGTRMTKEGANRVLTTLR